MAKLVIEAGRAERHYWADLWRFRELFYFLAWRDILVRYKQTVVGIAWAVLRPVATMAIMTFVFGRMAGLASIGEVPYPLMVFAAMLPWQFFSSALSLSSDSLVGNSSLIAKIYFPRFIIPGSAIIVSFVDFLVSAAVMAILMTVYHFCPDWRISTLPFFILMAFLAALGPGLLFTALTVRYRDFRVLIPFVVQIGLYVTPVGFSSEIVRRKFGEKIFLLYSMNPMVGVIDGFRWSLLRGQAHVFLPGFIASIGATAGALWCGIQYFRRVERTFADVI
jgi:lipopolysaccharide transport system permease protein